MIRLLLGTLFFLFSFLHSAEQPPEIGNFSLRQSQQISPLVGFGDLLLDRGQTQVYLYYEGIQGECMSCLSPEPYILFGITDHLSLLISVPVVYSRQDSNQSFGLDDLYYQVEYAFYNSSKKTYIDQGTAVFSTSFPTGSPGDDPPTGNGAFGYFAGLTFNRTTIDWFFYTAYGVTLFPSQGCRKVGNQYYYQLGLGRLFATWKGWIFSSLIELDGTYTERNRMNSVPDPDTGGNQVFLTPSVWLSSEKLILQFGFGVPVQQNLFGNQPKSRSLFTFNVGWTF